MNNLATRVFGHPEITSKIDLDIRIKYTDKILSNSAIHQFKMVLLACKETAWGFSGDYLTIRVANNITMEQLWGWSKVDVMGHDEYEVTGEDRFVKLYKEFWFDLVKSMWRNHSYIFQYQLNYIHNDVVNPFRVGILWYYEHVHEMHGIAKFMPPPFNKGG